METQTASKSLILIKNDSVDDRDKIGEFGKLHIL